MNQTPKERQLECNDARASMLSVAGGGHHLKHGIVTTAPQCGPLHCPNTRANTTHQEGLPRTMTSPSGAMRLTVLPSLVISGIAVAAAARPRRRKARMTAGSGLHGVWVGVVVMVVSEIEFSRLDFNGCKKRREFATSPVSPAAPLPCFMTAVSGMHGSLPIQGRTELF
jgi:hypothetical protein